MELPKPQLTDDISRKPPSPAPEETTASDYFATKKKAARSTPPKAKASANNHSAASEETPGKKPAPTRTAPSTPAKMALEEVDPQNSGRSLRASKRSSARKNYAENQESDGDLKRLGQGDSSGEDTFHAEKRGKGQAASDYKSDGNNTGMSRSNKASERAPRGRKRKSAALSGSEEPERTARSKKANTSSTSKKTPKKSTKKEKPPEDAEMQDILDKVPITRAPTPPPRDPDQKFDFKANNMRSQPAPLAGTKEIPEGAENCLSGLTFVFTGLLDALGREEGQDLVKRYGGKITTAPSSKTDYVILGNDAGPKKLETVAKHKLKTINEDGLCVLIKTMPANGGSGNAAAKASEKREAEEKKVQKAAEDMARDIAKEEKKKAASLSSKAKAQPTEGPQVEDRLWTVKYAPIQVNQICGNKSQVEKLQSWLRNWHKSAKANFKKGGPDGSGLYRTVIIHGGPGIGKTTAAHLVAQLEGYDVVESNASDTRSKKLIENGLKGVLEATSLFGYLPGNDQKIEASKRRLVLIMDEVDGMSAGDRGGVGAMASVCRKTRIPIILICNERKLPKMKPFDHVAYELPFRKPTTEQIRSRIMTILFREGMGRVSPNVINALIEGAGADIRRIINMISTAKLDQTALDYDESKRMVSAWEKNVILRPWDITNKILGGGLFAQNSKVSLNEKAELYFNDHEFSYLMLQENYLNTNPILAFGCAGKEKDKKVLDLMDQAAESLSDGDLVDSMIHGPQQHWSLMPVHAMFSFVRPASFVSGSTGGRVNFTTWLGNNSKGGERSAPPFVCELWADADAGKFARCVKEIQGHMRLRASGDRHEIRQQYLPLLWTRLVKGLELNGDKAHGIEDIIDLMDSYFLTKDDWDAIYELGLGPQAVEKVKLSTQNKSNFTRKYNLASHPLPFMKAGGTLAPAKKGKDKPDLEEALEESDEDEVLVDVAAEEDEDELDLKKDKYVKAPKKKPPPKKAGGKKKVPKDGASASEGDEPAPAKPSKRGRPAGPKGKGKK